MTKQLPFSQRERMSLIDQLFNEGQQKQKTLPQNIPSISAKPNVKKSGLIIKSFEYQNSFKEQPTIYKDKLSNIYSINQLIVQNPQKQQLEYSQVKNSQYKLLEFLKPIKYKNQKKKDNFRLHNSESYLNNQQKLPNLSSSINTNIKTCNSYRIQVRQSFQDIIKCKICFTYIEYDNFQLSCKHSFHRDCLKDQLNQQVKQGQYHLKCISCNERIKNQQLRNLLNKSMIELYYLNQIKFIVSRYHNTVKFEKCKKCFFFWIKLSLSNTYEPFCQICESNK
ncbi:unnamed protein product [Paramecium octaurelia]|uniref:RING-type domain-containing protein n=1 Tax=Paramecium octaurelia TaxID=43137 RepID=A0A8S1TUF9_PAROT|nr:unnamed protein product [Paramecium octaurelia]